MILCVTGWFPVYGDDGHYTGREEFVVSHGINMDTDETVILPCEHPEILGAKYDIDIGEWILGD